MCLRAFSLVVSSLLFPLQVAASDPRSGRADEVPAGLRLSVLSSRPELVTAGDALVRVEVPPALPLDAVAVTLDGADVTGAFVHEPATHALVGVVAGMRLGRNVLRARATGAGEEGEAELELVNHPKEGPVFSGPRQTPFACETADFVEPVTGVRLFAAEPSPPPDCSVPPERVTFDHFYVSTSFQLKVFPAGTTIDPADLATGTTPTGEVFKAIVRMEVGTANRGIYVFFVPHDPRVDPPPTFASRPRGWNGRLVYSFGTGCNGGWYRQGITTTFVSETSPRTVLPGGPFLLTKGYALATSTLNNNSNDCNDVIAAETLAMTKERFIEAYGPPDETIGFGLSGGAMQQHAIAENYPGLVDGIVPGGSFPEALYGFSLVGHDTDLLQACFALDPVTWTTARRQAVAGFGSPRSLGVMAGHGTNIDPTVWCPPTLPAADRYDPISNPGGVRCDIFSAYRNVFGRSEETGLVRRTFDNVGVQYGLGALHAGAITLAQFLDLNERIGGFDADGFPTAARSVGDRQAIRTAYRTGRVIGGGLGLSAIPIIDYRSYADDVPQGDAHQSFQTFSMRARLEKANGSAANQVILQEELRTGTTVQYYTPVRSAVLWWAFQKMDAWIARVKADRSDRDARTKVLDAKRALGLVDACFARGRAGDPSDPILDAAACAALYPVYSYPRGVAGEGLANDVLACRLKPIDPADYGPGVHLGSQDLARLEAIFPRGVCDWSRPGIGQQPPAGAWIDYGDGQGEADGDGEQR